MDVRKIPYSIGHFPLLSLLLCFLLYPPQFSSSSPVLCRREEELALLELKRFFTIDAADGTVPKTCSSLGQIPYEKTGSWPEGTSCCHRDEVTCDPSTDRVVGLDLSCAQLVGTVGTNSSLFTLTHLESLNLAFNDLSTSSISPQFKVIAGLSQLVSLDLSHKDNTGAQLELPNLEMVIGNLTKLRQLHLDYVVLINSTLPRSIINLYSLSSISLSNYNLLGEFPIEILNLPHLRALVVGCNTHLHANFSLLPSWSSPLEVLDFTLCNFTSLLPLSIGESMSLRTFTITGCNFYGSIPSWVWNTTQQILTSGNHFVGELPSSVNMSKLSYFTYLDMLNMMLSGAIPSWLFTLPSLNSLSFGVNQFTSLSEFMATNTSTSLEVLDLGTNNLQGSIPESIFSLVNLRRLVLDRNNFSSTVNFSMVSKLKSLEIFLLSGNSLSLIMPSENRNSTTPWPSFSFLGLSSCNLIEFPDLLRSQVNLRALELADNKLRGEIPRWLLDIGNVSLEILNLSHNSLTGTLE
ncbi:hypothetical protein Dimus_024232 [Dionaea muscipula]